jgi:hypothetical protein
MSDDDKNTLMWEKLPGNFLNHMIGKHKSQAERKESKYNDKDLETEYYQWFTILEKINSESEQANNLNFAQHSAKFKCKQTTNNQYITNKIG